MQSNDYIKLLKCVARFISYGKHNILSIFEWEQAYLSRQTGKQAVLLKSFKRWNGLENKIVSGTGVELDIDGCEEKIRFFDISQTSDPKFGRKAKQETDSMLKEELTEITSADSIEIGFSHKHRGLLLTALWMELTIYQNDYENACRSQDNEGEKEYQINGNLLNHISTIYAIHSHFKSNWQNDSEVEMLFTILCNNTKSAEISVKSYLLSAFFSQLFQNVINLIVKIKSRFDVLVSNNDSDASENYYQKIRFYNICEKEKIAVCRLKPDEKVNANLSIESYEIIETLPYKPNMEREEFLEYLQSVFDNGLTEKHIVLVRKKDIYGVTIVTTYRVDVRNWGVRQEYINFNIEPSYYPISFYLRQIAIEYLDKEDDNGNGNGTATQPILQPQQQGISQPEQQIEEQSKEKEKSQVFPSEPVTKDNHVNDSTTTKNVDVAKNTDADMLNTKDEANKDKGTNQVKNKAVKKKAHKKKRTNILDKVNKLIEDMQNKSC